MKRNILLLLILAATIASCKRHLSKENARAQIMEAKHYPIIKEYRFTKGFIKDVNTEGNGVTAMIDEEEFKEEQKMIEDFEKNKLVTFEETPHREETTQFLLGTTVRTWTSVKISLTDEGKKYLIREDDKNFTVKLWETIPDKNIDVIETQKNKSAKADYMISNINITPFGQCFGESANRTSESGYFILNEGKWKITR